MNNHYWPVDLIGVLAEDEETIQISKQSIFINNQESLQFQVKLISQPPDSFPNVKFINCFSTYLEQWGFEDDLFLTREERKQNLRDFLNENLIVFNVEKKLLHNHAEVYNAVNIRLIPKFDSFTKETSLLPLPIFSKDRHGINYDEFIQKLQEKKYVGRIENISSEPNDTPPYIIWKEENQRYIVLGEFDKHQYAHGGFNFSIQGELKSIEFQKEWLDDSYIDQKNIPDLMFVTLELYQKIDNAMENGDKISEDFFVNQKVQDENVKDSQIDNSNENIAISDLMVEEEEMTSKKNQFNSGDNIQVHVNNPYEESDEYRFINHFINKTKELGLAYSEKDLINFHTAMKSSNLVILAGMSGTGKSKLVNAYRRALGLDNRQFTFISVRPSWTDDTDIIGYADTLNMVYRPGDSGLIDALKRAEEEEEKIFIICFDEMNLARVEHYFSQFLSILELEPGQRQLRLYNDELANRLYNSAQYPPSITIKQNVMFVGTVNIDESTHHFSDKVLDRANVIQLEVLPFTTLHDLGDKKKTVQTRDHAYYEKYENFINKNEAIELTENELSFLWELHVEIQKVNNQIGIGPRIVKQIDKYLKNLPITPIFSRKEAFDLQIVQRVLTKVRGSEDQLKSLIGSYDKTQNNVSNSVILDLLEKYKDISDFEKTKESIVKKARELKLNGYTI